jgi:hypothetical protein
VNRPSQSREHVVGQTHRQTHRHTDKRKFRPHTPTAASLASLATPTMLRSLCCKKQLRVAPSIPVQFGIMQYSSVPYVRVSSMPNPVQFSIEHSNSTLFPYYVLSAPVSPKLRMGYPRRRFKQFQKVQLFFTFFYFSLKTSKK